MEPKDTPKTVSKPTVRTRVIRAPLKARLTAAGTINHHEHQRGSIHRPRFVTEK